MIIIGINVTNRWMSDCLRCVHKYTSIIKKLVNFLDVLIIYKNFLYLHIYPVVLFLCIRSYTHL